MDFGFVGPAYTAPSITQDDQELINWYCEVDSSKNAGNKSFNITGDRGVIALYPTPGMVEQLTLHAGLPVRGFRPANGLLYAVCGNGLYSIDADFNSRFIANLLTWSGQVVITDNGTALYLTDGVTRYAYTWATDTFAIKTDGAFTGGSICDFSDNYMVYNRPGTRQWGCTDASSTVSSALNLGEKIGGPDNIVALKADKTEIWLLGSQTSEVWPDAGSFPFPFQRLPGSPMQHGCVAPYSVARLGESLAWLSRDTRGQGVVIHTLGYQQPNRISTHAVENDIANGVMDDAIAFTYQQEGHEFYVLTFPTQDKTWVYDLATGLWHKRAWRDSENVLHRIRANCCAQYNGYTVVGDWQNGKVYTLERGVYSDAGETILRRRRPPHVTSDLNRVFHHSLQVQFQPGVGLAAGQGSDPKMILRWSNDGGSTFGNDHLVPIGKMGKYKNRAIKRQLGEARDRVYEVDVTDPINAVIVSADLRISAGQS